MTMFSTSTHSIKATRNRFVILDSLIMVCGICWSLYLFLSLTGLTYQSQSTKTMLTSLKNLVIDNSRSTVTFNSTLLRNYLLRLQINMVWKIMIIGFSYSCYINVYVSAYNGRGVAHVRHIDLIVLKIKGFLTEVHWCKPKLNKGN